MSPVAATPLDCVAEPLGSRCREGDRVSVARVLAGLRLALLPIVFAGDEMVHHTAVRTLQFDSIMVLATLYSLVAAYRSRRDELVPRPELMVALDLALLAGLAYSSGCAFLELRAAFVVLPIGAAFLLPPRRIALASLAAFGTYLLVAFTHPARWHLSPVLTVIHSTYIAGVGIAAVVLGHLLTRHREEIVALAEARGRLIAQAVNAEEQARRQLAESLHDNAIQNLLAARQDLAQVREGDRTALDDAERTLRLTVQQLRGTIRELHPYMLEHLGLASALEAMAGEQAARGRFKVDVHVASGTDGPTDQLIATVSRELLANVVRHAGAEHVRLSLTRTGDVVDLLVEDDGCGFEPGRRQQAVGEGHIGLATAVERISAGGGAVEISSSAGQGTRVLCRLPAQAPAPDAPSHVMQIRRSRRLRPTPAA